MKVKGFISILLALAVSAGLAVTAMADGANVSSTNDEGIVVTADADMKMKTVVADFDVNGRLTGVVTKLVDAVKGDNAYTYTDLGVSGIGAQRKVMLWKGEADSIEPISMPGEALTDMNGYLTACVDYVETGADEVYIYFDSSSRDEAELVITAEKNCNVKLGGKTISIEEIEAGDVLTIKCGEDEWLEDMDSYEIMVSRNTADGVIAMYDTEEAVCTLEDGRSYVDMDLIPGKLELGTNYRLYLDVFGRIVYAEEIVDYGNIGVVTDIYVTDTGYKVRIFKSVGGADRYAISEEVYNELYDILYITEGEMYAVNRRVISYNITESGEIDSIEKLKGKGGEAVTYTPEAALFDNVKVIMDDPNDDTTTIIDEIDLIEGKKYKVWYFAPNAGNTYELAVVQAVQEIENTTPMAVYVSRTTEDTLEGTYDVINAYVDGELKELFVDTEFDFEPGDVFFFLKDADGFVTTIEPILKESVPTTYTELYNKMLDSNFDILNADVVQAFENASTDAFNDDTLVFCAIVDCVGNNVYVATKDTVTDVEAIDIDRNTEEYYIADDVNVCVYDYDYSALHLKNRISTSSKALFNYTLPGSAFADDYKEILNLRSETLLSENNADYGKIRFAVLKVVDDEVTEALVFRPSSSKE